MGNRQDDGNWNPRVRNQGSPFNRGDQREAGRIGLGRDGVIPSQSSAAPSPKTFGANYYPYFTGAPLRPSSIKFDNGFLDKFKKRPPTASDYIALAKWKAKLEVAQSLRPDLAEACISYKHFLEGMGRTRNFSYDMYVLNDKSGRVTLSNAILDIQDGAEELWEKNKSLTKLFITGDPISCGSGDLFPYPATENWQKAIGGHVIWLSGEVYISEQSGEKWFVLFMTLHAEDRYNFNPGQSDIATGIPDSDNGLFEITGLGKQFNQVSELKRRITWKYGTIGKSGTTFVSTFQR